MVVLLSLVFDYDFFLLELSKKEIDVVTIPDKSSMLVCSQFVHHWSCDHCALDCIGA